MALPTAYTEATFKAYLFSQIAGLNLTWTVDGGDFDEIVISVGLYLSAEIADISDIKLLRAVGRRELWLAVMQASGNKATAATGVAGSIQFGKTIFDRAQALYDKATAEVELLEGEVTKTPSLWAG